MKKKRKHRTAYQKATANLEKESRRQCIGLYGSAAIALSRYHNKGKQAIINLFEVTGSIWHDCAESDTKSMIELCYRETGIEIQNETGKSWEELTYLNGTIDERKMSTAQWVYMRQRQYKWVAPQIMACLMIALHRKYGYGFERCARVYSQIDAIRNEYGNDYRKIHDICMKETCINVEDIYTTPRRKEEDG